MLKPVYKTFIVVALTALAFMFSALPADAFLKAEDVKPLDRKVAMTKEQFHALSDVIEFKSDIPDSGLDYKVRIPKGWIMLPAPKMDAVSLSAEIFTDISTYVSPARGDIRSRFRVRALELKHLVSAENWFLNYTLSVGSTIDGLLVKSGQRLEAEYTVLDGGQSYVVRASAQVSGSKIVVAEYLVPSEYAAEEREQQIWSIATFILTNPSQRPIEAVDTYTFVDIVKFEYPQSWVLYSPPITTIDRMEASIINLKGTTKDKVKDFDLDNLKLDGRIDVKVISKTLGTTEAEEIAYLKKALKDNGLEIGELMSPIENLKLNPGIVKSKVDSYRLGSPDGKLAHYEMWVGMLETQGRFYVITLVSVGREENFYVWAQNIEAFKFVLSTLAPVNDAE